MAEENPARLMIVDDSNIIRNKISRINQSGQFKVVGRATNGAEAIEKFKSLRPSIVTMDLTMPKMGGLECITELVDIDPDVRILVVSSLSDKFTGIQALQYGARGFVCKPFTDEQIAEALNELTEED